MLKRLVPLGAVLALAGLVASGCGEQSAALRVGDERVSQSELYEELDLIATDKDFRDAALGQNVDPRVLRGELAGSYSQQFVGSILQQRVRYLLADDILAKRGIKVSDADRAGIRRQLDRLLPNGVKSLPVRYRTDLVEGLARLNRLQSELGPDGAVAALDKAEADADITVASPFGRWDADKLVVVPPAGPLGAPGGGTAQGGTGSSPG